MRTQWILPAGVALFATCMAMAADFETPPQESAAASLLPDEIAGANFHIDEPVLGDGLMRHYVVDSRYGRFAAYGHEALRVRLREIAALDKLTKITDVDAVVRAVGGGVQTQVQSAFEVAAHPIGTVAGIPKGVEHLFQGFTAQARSLTQLPAVDGSTPSASAVGGKVRAGARQYADRYLGVSAAERHWYEKLGVDPYNDNIVLRRAVTHLAKVDAAVSLGMKFGGVPGLPYAADLRRTLDAIYHEDPAVLRERRRQVLASYGLEPAEIERFSNTLLLSPTRQQLLEEIARSLDHVAGRAELFRHAMSLTSEEEVQVFLQSASLLTRLNPSAPISRLLPGLRLPAAQLADGQVIVVGAFDSVYWTEDVTGFEGELRAALPPGVAGRALALSGSISDRARAELAMLGWTLLEQPAAVLPAS